jgi:cell division protein ZapA (FtsZ GTPase activity inhibitor)
MWDVFDWIWVYIVSHIVSILIGALLLLVALVVLPERLSLWVVKKVKKDLTSKKFVMGKVKIVFDYLFNPKSVTVAGTADEDAKIFQDDLRDLIQEKKLLESNLFFLDLLQNLSDILHFSMSHSGFKLESIKNTLYGATEYLLYYSKQLKPTQTSGNQHRLVSMAAIELQEVLKDYSQFIRDNEGEDILQLAQDNLRNGISGFTNFSKDQYQACRNRLISVDQQICDKSIRFLESRS